jgi:uncharacterized phiE125 gp8 family phage protein
MRRLLRKRVARWFEASADDWFMLSEYPVREVRGVYAGTATPPGRGRLLAPEDYRLSPFPGALENFPYCVRLTPACAMYGTRMAVMIEYVAGYKGRDVPADLKTACLELAAWNYRRFGERKIGVEGGMPENVKELLAPYKRRVI